MEAPRTLAKIRTDASTVRKKVRKAGGQMTWSQALNSVAQLYGFRDYREAKERLPRKPSDDQQHQLQREVPQ